MTVRHLKVFIKVCECNYSISRASEELMVAQPSVSQTIKELESYYNVILFNRINKRLLLTKEGEILLHKAKEVVSSFDDFESIAGDKNLNVEVIIGATMTFGVFIVPRYIKLVKDTYPHIKPRFIIDTAPNLEAKLLSGEIDFAFIEGATYSDKIRSIEIGHDQLVLLCAPDYPAPSHLTLEELAKHPLLLREKDNPNRRLLEYHFGARGLKIENLFLEGISNNSILALAESGDGIGILPEPITRRLREKGTIRLIELDTPLYRKLLVSSYKDKVMSTNVKSAYKLAEQILAIYRKEKGMKED